MKEQTGHSSIQATVNLYGHLIPGGNKQAVDRWDSMLSGFAVDLGFAIEAATSPDAMLERGQITESE